MEGLDVEVDWRSGTRGFAEINAARVRFRAVVYADYSADCRGQALSTKLENDLVPFLFGI